MTYFYRPEDGHGLAHDPFKAIVAPRPIGWISTRARDGRVNLAPYSFFNAVCGRPPIVMFSSGGEKDSVAFARESGEFACNFVSRALADPMNATSAPVARGVSEFALAGLTAAPCREIAAPRVAEAPATLECVVTGITEPLTRDGKPSGSHVVFGEVVGVHIDEQFLSDGLFDTRAANPLMRMGYFDYGVLGDVFALNRPQVVSGLQTNMVNQS